MSPHATSHGAPTDAGWRALPDTYRALVIRNRADFQFLAVQQQHERVQEYCCRASGTGLISDLPHAARGSADIDFFLVAIRRLRRVCELARRRGLSATASLRPALKAFADAVKDVPKVRDILEHLDDAAVNGKGGIGYGIGANGVVISYNGALLDTHLLYEAAEQVHTAIRSVVDPIAARDPHGQYSTIDLTAPDTAPGMEAARQSG
jgi:hypothetical protein